MVWQIQRPESLKSRSKSEAGGLSGRPLKAMATKCVSDMYTLTKGQVAIIAVRASKRMPSCPAFVVYNKSATQAGRRMAVDVL